MSHLLLWQVIEPPQASGMAASTIEGGKGASTSIVLLYPLFFPFPKGLLMPPGKVAGQKPPFHVPGWSGDTNILSSVQRAWVMEPITIPCPVLNVLFWVVEKGNLQASTLADTSCFRKGGKWFSSTFLGLKLYVHCPSPHLLGDTWALLLHPLISLVIKVVDVY